MSHDSANNKTPARVGFVTIGCRANQADTSRMISRLPPDAVEIDIQRDPCDIIVVNTCAVTAKAEADSRKLIRRAKRSNPDALVIVTGCAVEIDPSAWLSLPEVDLVIGLSERDRIEDYIFLHGSPGGIVARRPPGGTDGVGGSTPLRGHKSRPFLKIQDGCSRGCAYCIVPRARGPERSRTLQAVRDDILRLSDAGYMEIVLTGVHLGRWGRDLGLSLSDLLNALEKIDTDSRIRLSSLEPMDLDPSLIERILTNPRICPHLHLPLQSGDQGILDAMGRGHTLRDYSTLVETAMRVRPDAAIGADVMVGFPGENVGSHQNTLSYINSLPFAYLHIFSFSPRDRTRAAEMPGRPQGSDIQKRMRDLKALDAARRRAFRLSQLGKTRMFLIEAPPYRSGRVTALSDNFIRICPEAKDIQSRIGNLLPLIIDNNSVGPVED